MKLGKLKTTLFAAAGALLMGCATAPAEPQFPPGPALFVARDADSTMYLFGTLHIRRSGAPWGGAQAQAGLAEAAEVWTEMLISPETDAQTQSLAIQHGMAEEGRPLSSYFSAEENARIAATAQRLGLQMQMLERMKPWLVGVTLSVMPMLQAGYDPAQGADRLIDAYADQHGKTQRSFETAEEQIRMLAGFSDEVQRQMVLEALDEIDEGGTQMETMATAWETGDLATLERMVVTEFRTEYPEFYEKLLADRNDAWVETLDAELRGAGVDFVAVGAGHMLGEDGVVAQLRARGYTVERVE
ncbi:MAG TPA: TraB/GumN family protein [Vitreimonas sp.]|uniref:TraB/GumN family protein n=1 Tax=Vitreimonas sp. TaxID=3069702 RepID=UPI002D5CE1CE|nr:TraB/GumN family protein [Vitreimonas sp.]HYD88889.1 TraB/GumN family protein [Vitreimonas sp.]